jgi:hypothetical protein
MGSGQGEVGGLPEAVGSQEIVRKKELVVPLWMHERMRSGLAAIRSHKK